MMQNSSNNFLKRSKTCSKSLMPVLTSATSHLLGGPCLITSLDDYRVMPFSTAQPINRVFEFPTRQISSDQEDGSDLHAASAHQPAKKKRLTGDQVMFLESNFNLDSKLEPERKSQLAYELGLQPRQVAIWYQNKRARSKTKQLEQKYDALKEEYEEILAEKRRLEAEVIRLRELLGLQEKNKLIPSGASAENGVAEASNKNDQHLPKDESALAFEKEWHLDQFKGLLPAEKQQDEEEKPAAALEDDLPAETDVESVEWSCGTGQSEALDANSPASSYEQQKTPALAEPSPCEFPIDHRLFSSEQHQLQHNLINYQQGTVKLENCESFFLNPPIAPEVDQLNFWMENETTFLYCDHSNLSL